MVGETKIWIRPLEKKIAGSSIREEIRKAAHEAAAEAAKARLPDKFKIIEWKEGYKEAVDDIVKDILKLKTGAK